jgi:DNA-binding transcriptional regulator LsrR (DeoR family)
MPHPSAKLTTTALRRRVVRLWNAGDKTQADIAALLGLTRGAVGRLIAEARAMGMPTIRYSTQETAERAQASYRARVGEAAFTERMYRMWEARTHHARRRAQGTAPSPDGHG